MAKKRMDKLQDLVEEAKNRTVLYAIFIIVFATFLSLTSNSVLFNIPLSILIISVLRYFSLEVEIRRRRAHVHQESHLSYFHHRQVSHTDRLLLPPPVSKKWKRRIDSPVIAAAVEEFTRNIVQEFITDLWYSSITPDQEFPDQICLLINDVLGEVSQRLKHVNLIDLLTRDVVDLIGSHIELYRRNQAYIGVDVMATLSSEERDERLKHYLAASKELHPALISSEAECKVLQRLMGAVVAIVLRPQDAECPLVLCLARELLACAVMQPIMNFASPMFINELIEFLSLSAKAEVLNKKTDKDESGKLSNGNLVREQPNQSCLKDMPHSAIEPNYLRSRFPKKDINETETNDYQGRGLSSLHNDRNPDYQMKPISYPQFLSGDWAQLVEAKRQRRTQFLTPENLDDLWTKGRSNKLKDISTGQCNPGPLEKSSVLRQDTGCTLKCDDPLKAKDSIQSGKTCKSTETDMFNTPGDAKKTEKVKHVPACDSQSSGLTECQDSDQSKRVSHINVKLASERGYEKQENSRSQENQLLKVKHRRSKSSGTAYEGSEKFDRSSFLEDRVNPVPKISQGSRVGEMRDHFHVDNQSAAGWPHTVNASVRKLDCWVLGVHFERVGLKSIAVYSIAVTNSEKKSWVVDRRFRNFEQLHRYLRDIPNYRLQLPPKRIISSNLDDFFIRERCILLEKYLKDLLSIPNIAERHEVWDFLSVTSKNYSFGKNPSVMETLAFNVDDAMVDIIRQLKGVSSGLRHSIAGTASAELHLERKGDYRNLPWTSDIAFMKDTHWDRMNRSHYLSDEEEGVQEGGDGETHFLARSDGWQSDTELHEEYFASRSNLNLGGIPMSSSLEKSQQSDKTYETIGSDESSATGSLTGSEMIDDGTGVPQEWAPPRLSVPMLNLVDKIFRLHERGWIRRQVFWIAKQILQLLMEDAIDDWLLRQIQWLKREDVIAYGIRQVQDVLLTDVIFTSENGFQQQTENARAGNFGGKTADRVMVHTNIIPPPSFQRQLESARRARLVHDMILGAPAPLVRIIGTKQYNHCANDIYFFLQSTVCVKQLAYSLLELLLITIFPELHDLICDIRNCA